MTKFGVGFGLSRTTISDKTPHRVPAKIEQKRLIADCKFCPKPLEFRLFFEPLAGSSVLTD